MMSIDRRLLKAKLEVAPHPAYRLRKLRLYVSAPSTITIAQTGQSLVKGVETSTESQRQQLSYIYTYYCHHHLPHTRSITLIAS
jgi:hypothetical protein